MAVVIAYQNPDATGGVSVVYPTGELSLKEVAYKDVPFGAPYLFLPSENVPTDTDGRAAWEIDFSKPDGIGGIK